jgi:hypothetical protein
MRQVGSFVILTGASAFIACTAQTVTPLTGTVSPRGASTAASFAPLQTSTTQLEIKPAPTQIGFAPPRNAPATAIATPQITSAVSLKNQLPTNGYRRIVVNGQERYCRNDLYTGSHAERNPVCLTQAQWQSQQDHARQYIEDVERLDAQLPANPMNIGGAVR